MSDFMTMENLISFALNSSEKTKEADLIPFVINSSEQKGDNPFKKGYDISNNRLNNTTSFISETSLHKFSEKLPFGEKLRLDERLPFGKNLNLRKETVMDSRDSTIYTRNQIAYSPNDDFSIGIGKSNGENGGFFTEARMKTSDGGKLEFTADEDSVGLRFSKDF